MILEVLYPEVASMYGDSYNVIFLKETLKDKLSVINTKINDVPYFVKNDVDMIYIGSMMERFQEVIIQRLMPHKDRIVDLINNGVVFLSTGNSLEIFGKSIDSINGLNIFNFHSERDFSHHHNSCYLGKFNEQYITGFKSCFSYTSSEENGLFETVKGFGFKNDNTHEGIRKNNFFGTYLIGPILVLNPDFTHYLLSLLNADCKLIYEESIREAYNKRVEEYLQYDYFKEFKH